MLDAVLEDVAYLVPNVGGVGRDGPPAAVDPGVPRQRQSERCSTDISSFWLRCS